MAILPPRSSRTAFRTQAYKLSSVGRARRFRDRSPMPTGWYPYAASVGFSIRVVSPKARAELAREHLDRALPAVTAEDHTEAVTWLFAALEAAIVAVAESRGIDTKKQHWKKAEAAKQLHDAGALPHDFSDTLDILNEARKVAVYEGEEPDLGDQSLEDIAADVETAVELAEQEGAQ